jgi:hypothetical protein
MSLADVRDAARQQTAAATSELSDGVFEEPGVQLTVSGHVTAALDGIPTGDLAERSARSPKRGATEAPGTGDPTEGPTRPRAVPETVERDESAKL